MKQVETKIIKANIGKYSRDFSDCLQASERPFLSKILANFHSRI